MAEWTRRGFVGSLSGAAAATIIQGSAAAALPPPDRRTGSAPIKQIDVVKNNQYIHQVKPGKAEVQFEYVDTAIKPGSTYYYVRIEQTDGQLAWSSPIWLTR